ncbi:MAG: HAD-IA family hydrolase [bacterium]|nr:HAD-IA family hydrolase [bacterium]
MAIKIVLWDIGNVVVDSHHSVGIARLVELGVPYMRAREFFKHPSYRDFARGTIDGVEFWRQQNQQLGSELALSDMRDAHDAHMFGVDEEVLQIVRAVKLPIAWATATNQWQTRRQQELIDLQQMFPDAPWFCSNKTGKLKTDPGAFNEIVAGLGVKPHEILFVDDSEGNCLAASSEGIPFIWYKGAQHLGTHLALNGCL